MNIDFVITHLSHGSPGSFYRPYELLKELIIQGNNGQLAKGRCPLCHLLARRGRGRAHGSSAPSH